LPTVILVTDRAPFENTCRTSLLRFGFSVTPLHPEKIAETAHTTLPVIFDADSSFFDTDELLTGLGIARAAGAVAAVVLSPASKTSDIEDIIDVLCPGLVARSDDEIPRIVRLLARRCDQAAIRSFEYVTVSPHSDDLLAIWVDGTVRLIARPLSAEDDGGEITDVALTEDAAAAVITLTSGRRILVPASIVVQQSASFGNNHATGATSAESASQETAVPVGERLRRLRISAGLTQAELARRTGIRRPNIARVEGGRHVPSLETISRLASALGTSTANVFSGL
jgi:DNA-binding XRE family transcriptional regulator